MAREYKNLQMAIYIKDSIVRESLQDLDNIIGLMEATLKGSLRLV